MVVALLLQIILERATNERDLVDLARKRYIVPEDLTLVHFQGIIRKRLNLPPERALFLLINAKTIVSLSKPMDEIYREYRAEDGCLHIVYASQDCFG